MTSTVNMVGTSARSGLTPTQWSSEFFTEYLRDNQFSRYLGTSENSMIQVREDLTRKQGDSVVFPTVKRLTGAGVTGSAVLRGNEEAIDARSLKLSVDVIRHAVAVTDREEQYSVIDLLQAGRTVLMNWAKEKFRADIIAALGAITLDGNATKTYAAASAAERNAFIVNNSDRVQFGATVANAVSNVFATAAATIDGTNDKLSASMLRLAKRRARTASPHIRPIKVNNDEEWFVAFIPSLPWRDLMTDTSIQNALLYAADRGKDNPLFTAGDVIYDGMILREIPELPVIADIGDSASVDVAATYICGAQALGVAYAQRTKSVSQEDDYGFVHGVGVQEMRGIGKLRFGSDASVETTKPVDAGLYTLWTSAEPDA